jgi:hypothetical protein
MANLTHEERLFRFIYSMATAKSKLGKTLGSHNEVRIEHLLKLYFYPEAERDRDGWKRSVLSSLRSVPLLKNGKFPDEEFLYDEIWVKPFASKLEGELDRRVTFLTRIVHDYKAPSLPISPEIKQDFCRICEGYCSWLADWLSLSGRVSWLMVYQHLDRLLETSKYVK